MPVEAHAQAGAAGNDEDSSCARLLHARRNGLRADESPLEIHVEDGLPLVQGDGFQRLPRLSDGAAGAVDEDVHPAAGCRGFFDQGRHRSRVGNVGDGVMDAAAFLGLGGVYGFLKHVRQNVAGPHVAPEAASPWTIARPIPWAAPVTRAVFPLNSIFIIGL